MITLKINPSFRVMHKTDLLEQDLYECLGVYIRPGRSSKGAATFFHVFDRYGTTAYLDGNYISIERAFSLENWDVSISHEFGIGIFEKRFLQIFLETEDINIDRNAMIKIRKILDDLRG